MSEAQELRQAGIRQRIMVFSDASPYTLDKHQFFRQWALEPILSDVMSLLEFQKLRARFPLEAHVEVNTGMNRLGIPVDSLALIRFQPQSIFTHLADADRPRSTLTQKQIQAFSQVVEWAQQKFPRALLHFANSAALWLHRDYPLLKQMQLARPGLSLYGVRPFEKASTLGLKRVMKFELPVLQKILLQHGDQVGYGGTYICQKRGGEWIATLGGGYADGVFRSLSGQGVAVFKSKKLRMVGRVSMDLCAVFAPKQLEVGDWITLWGDEVDPYEQAGLAGTIPYEWTTRIGSRVARQSLRKKSS